MIGGVGVLTIAVARVPHVGLKAAISQLRFLCLLLLLLQLAIALGNPLLRALIKIIFRRVGRPLLAVAAGERANLRRKSQLLVHFCTDCILAANMHLFAGTSARVRSVAVTLRT